MNGKSGFFAALLTSLVAFCGVAHAESWRMAMDVGLESAEGKGIQRFAELVEKYSNGDLTIRLFPYEQLGSSDAVGEQLSKNTIQMQTGGLVRLSKWLPEVEYINAPFLFDDREHWVRFMQSDLVKGWFRKVEEDGRVPVLGDPTLFLRGPYRVIVSTTPVASIDDLKGVKLRLHPDDLAAAVWKTLGADVRVIAWAEVYQGLSRSIVTAVNTPISLVESTRFQEVAKHITRHDEYWQSVGFMVNTDALEALSPETRAALEKAYAEAAVYGTEVVEKDAKESVERMRAEGVSFHEMDLAPFSTRLKTFYEERGAAGQLPEGFVEAVEAARQAR